ncbi:hypothetical protein LOD99_7683 [Oopsacas minuta]|uniref:PH domain-containing protein n=1 Tax=Oopsacas minuta TaxID=111878 RepID=A0AAV7JPL3_9METZ|nr:hypothetical protein LOD99_7683 [Oopsacas minuta]
MMAFRTRSQRKTKKIPESVTIDFAPDANTFNLQILESNLSVYTGTQTKGKWKKTHVVLQSGKGVFTSLLFYKKPSKFIAKLAPLGKHDLHLGFDVSLGDVIKSNKYVIDIVTHGENGTNIRLAADSEEIRSTWIHELITKRTVDPLSSECLKWFVVRIKDTVGTNRLKLNGKCTLCIYRNRIVLATLDGVMLGEFPLNVIKSYKCLDEFHLSLSPGSMYGEISLFIITEQKRELFEKIHRLKMQSMGRDDELPPPAVTKCIPKQSPDDNVIRAPTRRPSKRDDRGKLQDSASETDILGAVMACDKPMKPHLPRNMQSLAVRSHSNASAFMKPRMTRMNSPSMYVRNPEPLHDQGQMSPLRNLRRPSEPHMLHSDRKKSAQFLKEDSFMMSSVKTHCQFTTPDLYDHVIFKPQAKIQAIDETDVTTSASVTQYDSIQPQRRKKINIYESLSFNGDNHNNHFVKPRDPNEIPDIPITTVPPKRIQVVNDNITIPNSVSAPNNMANLSDNSFSSQAPHVFISTDTSPAPPLPPHGENFPPPQEKGTHYSDLFKPKGEIDFIKPTSSLKGLHSYKRASLSNQYETINFGFYTLGTRRRKAVKRMKLGKAKSEMPPDMLANPETDNITLKIEKSGIRPSSFNLSKNKHWEVT